MKRRPWNHRHSLPADDVCEEVVRRYRAGQYIRQIQDELKLSAPRVLLVLSRCMPQDERKAICARNLELRTKNRKPPRPRTDVPVKPRQIEDEDEFFHWPLEGINELAANQLRRAWA